MSWANNFNPIIEHENPYWCRNEVITMDEGISQKLFQSDGRNLWLAQCVNILIALYVVNVSTYKTHTLMEYVC